MTPIRTTGSTSLVGPRANRNGPLEDVRNNNGSLIGYRHRATGQWVKLHNTASIRGFSLLPKTFSPTADAS